MEELTISVSRTWKRNEQSKAYAFIIPSRPSRPRLWVCSKPTPSLVVCSAEFNASRHTAPSSDSFTERIPSTIDSHHATAARLYQNDSAETPSTTPLHSLTVKPLVYHSPTQVTPNLEEDPSKYVPIANYWEEPIDFAYTDAVEDGEAVDVVTRTIEAVWSDCKPARQLTTKPKRPALLRTLSPHYRCGVERYPHLSWK